MCLAGLAGVSGVHQYAACISDSSQHPCYYHGVAALQEVAPTDACEAPTAASEGTNQSHSMQGASRCISL